MKDLILSFSAIDSFLDCEGIWYWRYVKQLELDQWKIEFLAGNLHQYGVYLLMAKVKNPEKELVKYFDKEAKALRKSFAMSTADEQKIIEAKTIAKGMMKGYAERYAQDLKIEKHIANESDQTYQLGPHLYVRIKLDNIMEVKSKWYLHEMKAWSHIKPEVINNLKSNLQTALYFHIHNAFMKKGSTWKIGKNTIKVQPFSGIIFDVMQKPSIHKKQGEKYKEYLQRLGTYYEGPEASNKFYKDVFKTDISQKQVLNTINEASVRMFKMMDGNQPMLSYKKCAWCDYRRLCLEGGATKKNLAYYRKRERLDNPNKPKGAANENYKTELEI